MSSGGENRGAVRRVLLDGWEWVYLLSLLLPLFVYNLALKTVRISSLEESHGLLWHLSLMRSELLFNAGYAILCIGLFAVARRGVLRAVSLVVLHVTAIAVVVISTSSYQYYGTTGSSLDYGIVSYYFATPGEAQGAISSEMAISAWLVLSLGLFYALAGPLLVTRAAERLGLISSAPRGGAGAGQPPAPASSRWETPEQDPPEGEAGERETPTGMGSTRRRLSRKEFLAVGAGAGAGVFLLRESLLPSTATGASGGVARSPVSNLIATRAEAARMQAAAEGVEVTNTLTGVRLSPTARTRRRHVALIHLESVRERSVTIYDDSMRTTPYLDDLASRSLVVERAYTTQPHTTNAITSVNAGMYPYPGTDIVESQPGGVPARCLPDLLRDQGYRTAWFQSAVGGFEDRPQLVENFGYDHFQAIEEMDTEGFQMSNYLGYEDDIMLDPSREWLEENLEAPTLITYLGVTPHHDYQVPDRYGRKDFEDEDDDLDRYLNNVRYDDFWVRNIIEQYKELGIYEDTIFVIYGDHGEGFGEHGRYQHDGVIWEEGVRVPLLIHDPQRYAGERVKGPANLMDIPPTLAEMLGYRVVDGEYPGDSLLNLPSDRTLYINCRPDLLSMASIKGYDKFIYHFGKQPDELFDLRRDPLEQRNLARSTSEGELEQRRNELLEWHARTGALYSRAGSRRS